MDASYFPKIKSINIRAHTHPHTYIVRLTDRRTDKNVIENLAGTLLRYDPITFVSSYIARLAGPMVKEEEEDTFDDIIFRS